MSNGNDNQELERPAHFKDVFGTSKDSGAADNGINTTNVDVSESRRPSVVVPTSIPSNIHDDSLEADERGSCLRKRAAGVADVVPLAKRARKAAVVVNSSSAAATSFSAHVSGRRRFRSRSLPNLWNPENDISSAASTAANNNSATIATGASAADTAISGSDILPGSPASSTHTHRHSRHRRRRGAMIHASHLAIPHSSSRGTSGSLALILPPVNLQSMREIDLHEVLKNPQLRHDILFDPQLQFRPNLDGERGKRKRLQADSYWAFITEEISTLLTSTSPKPLTDSSPIAVMFQALKGILLSLVPAKDRASVEDILDSQLILQQLNARSFDFVGFADWIERAFKMHCAPMRDSWVDNMNSVFHKACAQEPVSVEYLVEGLRAMFSILEAMKLDVANHQIRILRPLLCSTAVSFEKEYFASAARRGKVSFTLAQLWYRKNEIACKRACETAEVATAASAVPVATAASSATPAHILCHGILRLLSCSTLTPEFPSTFCFDHARLAVLRADIRHVVCTQLCSILYKSIATRHNITVTQENLRQLKKDILGIIMDEAGNSKWTRNLHSIAVHITNSVVGKLDAQTVDFCFSWLLRQTQPSSKVYVLLEQRVMVGLLGTIDGTVSEVAQDELVAEELQNVAERLKQLVEMNYSVFGEVYETA
ncbi:DEKNAAC102424 [Brettanomyces naardenensis]|uniref:DEKNAAC102424 n=1 Tax=Brettanomyces naardenensis TaxID=13370 RepID=A0A448YLU2_BRENA|nr:DEKNAAC102424 [Brettanomyces naardenensis]